MSWLKSIKSLINDIQYKNCANEGCMYEVERLHGKICVCSNDCYDALREKPEHEKKLIVASR
jgi:hypothetical protein